MHTAATQYVGVINDQIVCHTGIIYFPMRKGWKRVHRFVVLPDYQGCGIGTRFIKEVAKQEQEKGFRLNLTTTTPQLVHALCKDSDWVLHRYGRSTGSFKHFDGKYEKQYGQYKHFQNATSCRRITYSFNYLQKK